MGAAIVEDDYDSEFHYDGPAGCRPARARRQRSRRHFYVGTFSKSTFADVRTGYAIVPAGLVEVFEKAQRHSGCRSCRLSCRTAWPASSSTAPLSLPTSDG